MEQLISIHDNKNIKNYAIFEGGLVTFRSKTTLKGYHQMFTEFFDSLKKAAPKLGGCEPLNVNIYMSEVDKLWETVKEFIDSNNTYMKLLLEIFSIEKGNGLSPLMVEMNYMKYLCTTVIDLSKRPQKDLCDPPTNNRNSYTYHNGDKNVIVVSYEYNNSNNYTFMTPT